MRTTLSLCMYMYIIIYIAIYYIHKNIQNDAKITSITPSHYQAD